MYDNFVFSSASSSRLGERTDLQVNVHMLERVIGWLGTGVFSGHATFIAEPGKVSGKPG